MCRLDGNHVYTKTMEKTVPVQVKAEPCEEKPAPSNRRPVALVRKTPVIAPKDMRIKVGNVPAFLLELAESLTRRCHVAAMMRRKSQDIERKPFPLLVFGMNTDQLELLVHKGRPTRYVLCGCGHIVRFVWTKGSSQHIYLRPLTQHQRRCRLPHY